MSNLSPEQFAQYKDDPGMEGVPKPPEPPRHRSDRPVDRSRYNNDPGMEGA